ncbi:hypothetical protein B0H16DRAFT_726375 [Mycena metata]|uniref:Secreted protein n=1 Tax=Mycena metata TaxID=1033252 RepID=A0AAD7K7A8_9AGAR|nr:hypothetical protein B0H16DRAFT_726375 [Mycena metata]
MSPISLPTCIVLLCAPALPSFGRTTSWALPAEFAWSPCSKFPVRVQGTLNVVVRALSRVALNTGRPKLTDGSHGGAASPVWESFAQHRLDCAHCTTSVDIKRNFLASLLPKRHEVFATIR